MGYLSQPHTSAGRVPTVQGYRLYVNELMERQRLSQEETERLNSELTQRLMVLDNLVADIGHFASQITDLPALAISAPKAVTVTRFDIKYEDANTFIMVALLSDNTVKNKLVRLPVSVEKAKIDKLQSPGDIQWGYQAIRGEVNVETDWNSYKSKNSKDYAAWKSIYQQVFDRNFK